MEDWQEKEFKQQEMLVKAVEGADRVICDAAGGDRELLAYYTVRVAQRFLDKVESMTLADLRQKEMTERIEANNANPANAANPAATQLQGADRREALSAVLTGSWHALKSYEYGNSATELAKEMCEAIERGARMLGLTLEGVPK